MFLAEGDEVRREGGDFFFHTGVGAAGQRVFCLDVLDVAVLDFEDAVGELRRVKGEAVDFPLHTGEVFVRAE